MQPIESTIAENSPDSESFKNALKSMLGATAGRFGDDFLLGLVKALSQVLKLDYVLIGRLEGPAQTKIRSLAVYSDNQIKSNYSYNLSGSPCEVTVSNGICWVQRNARELFSQDPRLAEINAEGYLGVTLNDSNNRIIGVLATISCKPLLQQDPLAVSVLQIFAYRVAAELEREAITQNLLDEVNVNQTQLDSVPALMFMLDRDGVFLRWNKYFRSKFGYAHQEMKSLKVLSAVHQDDRSRVAQEIEKSFSEGSGVFYLNGITKNNQCVPLLATAQTSSYEGKPVLVGVAMDMTEQQVVERNLLRSQGRLARKNSQLSLINSLVERLHASHSVKHVAEEVVSVLKDIEEGALLIFSIVEAGEQRLKIINSHGIDDFVLAARNSLKVSEWGSPTSIAIGSRQLEVFRDIVNDNRIDPAIKELIKTEKIVSGLVIPLIYKDKALGGITIGFKYEPKLSDDELYFYRTIGSSVSLALANARQFERMEELATQDSLTGLPNRNALKQDSHRALKRALLSGKNLGLILVDLDRFKEINDTLDHQIGDKLLRLIGPRIEHAINDDKAHIYRLGGDEFCVLVAEKEKVDQIEKIAELIRQVISHPFDVDGLNLEISSSIGVLTTGGEHHTASEMLRCAELAMYHAKNLGGGVIFYTPELDEDTQQRFVIMAEMAEAIRNNELVLHYQPKMDLRSNKIVGCEALVRWQHKKYGLLPPDRFIPLIELTQLIHPLTFWVIKKVMRQIRNWKQQGIKISVGINLSTRNLTDDSFVQQLDALMKEYGVEASEIEFEVTETAIMSNLDRASQQLHQFHKRGIQTSLDDYGTGYSSLSYIKKLPLDFVKIDRSFISLMLKDKADRTIARSTIELAHDLGKKVVAEGVEDEKTLDELVKQGCDMVQGFFISNPLEAEEFANFYWQHTN